MIVDEGERVIDIAYHPGHIIAGLFHDGFDIHRNQRLVLDDQDLLSIVVGGFRKRGGDPIVHEG